MTEVNNGITKLMQAASSGNIQAVLEELAQGGEIDAMDIFGHTALAYAAMAGHERIVKALLMMDAAVDTENLLGLTPATLAALRGHHHIAHLLSDDCIMIQGRLEGVS